MTATERRWPNSKEEMMTEGKGERPEFVTDADECLYLGFLDDLRESGETNMYGAVPYLLDEFTELSKDQAGQVLFYWMHTFSERH